MRGIHLIILVIGALIAPITLFADTESGKYLKVHFIDGTVHNFSLSSMPIITFPEEGRKVVFTTTDGTSLEYLYSDLDNYQFEDIESGINEILEEDDESVKINGTSVSMRGLRPNSVVRVFNPCGIELRHVVANGDGSVEVSLEDLPKGIYIVNHGKASVKIVR